MSFFVPQKKGENMIENYISNAPMILVLILLLVGFVGLVKGADYFVEGSSSVAKQFKVPAIIIGLTIVAMGTSLPETAVSVTASLAEKNALAVSNAIGSNIFNTMVVIGVCAMMTPVLVQKETIVRDIPFSALCAILLLALGVLGIADNSTMILGRMDGVILLALFAVYIVVLIRKTLKAKAEGKEVEVEGGSDEDIKLLPISLSILYIVAGGAAIAIGGDLTVDTACIIASRLGMSETLIGLTIVSIGTSLPELVTSIVAAKKNEVDMALGNAIGSNVFNILMVLGIASALSPIAFVKNNLIDIVILLVFTLVVWLFAATKKKLNKAEGFMMLVLYAAYAVYIVMREYM